LQWWLPSTWYIVQDSRATRNKVIHEWIKVSSYLNGHEGSARGKRIYILPTPTAPGQNYLIHKNGVSGLFGIGRVAWKMVLFDLKKGDPKKDQNGALSSKSKSNLEINNSMHVFLSNVENKVFPKVTLFFLVKGHTKNVADRMFNLLELSYHAKDIFTYDQLHAVLNENKYSNVMQMRKENFYNHLE